MTHYLLMPIARIQEGGRFAAVCSNSQLSNRDPFILDAIIQVGGRFAAVRNNSQFSNHRDDPFIDASKQLP